ncbi:neutral and basic amino acid transport protein rBAT [Syngnathus acus]|uniref:neutral and basic amino acid transport protein rBAT n=1 Tax=Syngnathus acus TaxID=161584 RepID=UPI001885CAB7|nr:neutral and basic amino acid transport protein rBAT [Syngnathus acus]
MCVGEIKPKESMPTSTLIKDGAPKPSLATSMELSKRNPAFQDVEGSKPVEDISAVEPEGKLAADPPDEEYTQIKPYAGMPKEVLLLYSSKARYRVPREVLFWLIVACTLTLVALTISVVVLSPRCLSWWQVSPIYQVYTRSFRDSDGDGVGDLKGIREKLAHFEYLNIKSVWVSTFYLSPMKDSGYDVEDFRAVDPLFGTMQDFDELLAEMHKLGLKLIVDFIPNHTSDKHRWFNLSRARDPHYHDYYVWADCNATGPKPNNWVSVFGNSSWTYDAVRGQCYLHQFLKEQPDLNFRNPLVRQEMLDIIQFWLDKGVDGFRMDAVKHLLEAAHLRDEPQVDPDKPPESVTSERDLHHDFTTTQLGLHDLLREWRAHMEVFSREPGRYRLMVSESYDKPEVEKTMMYYGTSLVKESDLPFNLYFLDLPLNASGLWARYLVHLWMANMPIGRWPNWMVGNHNTPRVASRAGRHYTRVINMLLLTLPGTPTTYYGEEIGMESINMTESAINDPASGRSARSPMQWSGAANAGFSDKSNVTWLPVHPNYSDVNVEVQRRDEDSVLFQYHRLSELRQSELPLQRGWFCHVHADRNVLAYLRELDGMERAFLLVLNVGRSSAVTDLSAVAELPEQMRILMSTDRANDGKAVSKTAIATEAGEGLTIEFSAHARFNANHPSQCYISEKACYLSALDILYTC